MTTARSPLSTEEVLHLKDGARVRREVSHNHFLRSLCSPSASAYAGMQNQGLNQVAARRVTRSAEHYRFLSEAEFELLFPEQPRPKPSTMRDAHGSLRKGYLVPEKDLTPQQSATGTKVEVWSE